MDAENVKRVYLSVLGNPQSGVFVDFADAISEAIVAEFGDKKPAEKKSFSPVDETRLEKITETR
jgi:hypothetical protein